MQPVIFVCLNLSIFLFKGTLPVETTAGKEENVLVAASETVREEDTNKTNANCQQKEQKQILQSLFSLLREEVEQMDSRILPLCLHQVFHVISCCYT